jgi:hypothetical protein
MKLTRTIALATIITSLALPAMAQTAAGSSGTQQRRDENSGRTPDAAPGAQSAPTGRNPAASPNRSPQAGTGGEGGGATTTDRNRTGTDPRANPGTSPR